MVAEALCWLLPLLDIFPHHAGVLLLRRCLTPRVLRLCVDAMRLCRRRGARTHGRPAHVLALLDLPQLQEAAGARKKSENQEWPSDEVSESP